MSTAESKWGTGANAEAIQAWDGPLYDRFLRFRHIVTTGLGAHGERALELFPPQPGQQVLDVGCGFGDTTQRIAGLVGPDGEAVGVDAAARFIEAARQRGRRGGRRERALRGRRRRDDVVRGALRPRLLAHGHDVLRQPGVGAAQRARGARARRAADDGRVAAADRQRLDLPRADDRRGDRRAAGGVRRADVRAGAVLDGRRGHDERGAAARRLRGRRASGAATSRSSSATTWTRRSSS